MNIRIHKCNNKILRNKKVINLKERREQYMVGCSGKKGKGEMEQYHNLKY